MRRSLHRALALLPVLALAATATPALAASEVTARRLAGPDRYATAVAISKATFDSQDIASGTTVVVARGDDFPDALSGINVPGGHEGQGPVLLTPFGGLTASTRDEIVRLDSGRGFVQGSTDVVSTRVEQQMRDLGIDVFRNDGADRYFTAGAAYIEGYQEDEHNGYITEVDGKNTFLLASGLSYADAMSAGPVSYRERLPLLLTDPRRLSEGTRRSLNNDGFYEQVYILGGTSAVSDGVVADLEDMGMTVRRIAGASRQDTAIEIFKFAEQHFGWDLTHVNLTRGDNYPDALAGGPHGGQERAPILLTVGKDQLGSATREFLRSRSDTIESIDVFGDATAVSDAVVEDARQAATSSN
jgi:D-alanyl-D-alanine carboxypeptidase